MDLGGALDRVSAAAEAARGRPAAPDPWGDALIGGEMSEAARHRVVSAIARRDFGVLLNAEPVVEAIRARTRELALTPEHGVERAAHRHRGAELRGAPDSSPTRGGWSRSSRSCSSPSPVCFALRSPGRGRSPRSARSRGPALDQRLRGGGDRPAEPGVGGLQRADRSASAASSASTSACATRSSRRAGCSRSEALVETARSIGSSLVLERRHHLDRLPGVPADGLPRRGRARPDLRGRRAALSLVATLTVLPALLALVKTPRAAPGARLAAAPRAPAGAAAPAPIRWGALAVGIGAALLAAAHPLRPQPDPPARSREPRGEGVPRPRGAERGHAVGDRRRDAGPRRSAEALAERLEALAPVKRADHRSPTSCRATRTRSARSWPARALPAAGRGAGAGAGRRGAARGARRASRRELARRRRRRSAPAARARSASPRALRALPRRPRPRRAGRRARAAPANVVGSLPDQLADLAVALAPERVTLDEPPGRAARPDARRRTGARASRCSRARTCSRARPSTSS